ncbi:hypothetical protein AB1Y20_002515 [Prymnesium parvum]|uniref:Gamma-glutamylcyclotransferase family protein n=1 Tax=Prymnesium parvum TaxID=97485 RepID=A0AB34JB31_PRYPA
MVVGRHRVLVYGSLLRGLHNHHHIEGSRLLHARARTRDAGFMLVDSGKGYPFAMFSPSFDSFEKRVRLIGELYEVSDDTLNALDDLEDHPKWYCRHEVSVDCDDSLVWVYLLNDAATVASILKFRELYPRVDPPGDWRSYLTAQERMKSLSWKWPSTRLSVGNGLHPVFSYGSNGLKQLRARVRNPNLTAVKALLPDAERSFGGWSDRWGGGVATVVPRRGKQVQGSLAFLTAAELAALDTFERTDPKDPYSTNGVYRRQDVTVLVGDKLQTPQEAVVYVMTDAPWHAPPSRAYLEACYTNVADFWQNPSIEVRDVTGKEMQQPFIGKSNL